jgi:hypothetical protein
LVTKTRKKRVLIDRPPLSNNKQLVQLSDEQLGDSCDDDNMPSLLLFDDPEFINFSGDLAFTLPVTPVARRTRSRRRGDLNDAPPTLAVLNLAKATVF